MGSSYFDHGGLHATPGGFNAHLTGHGTPLTGASGDGGARFTGGMTGEPRGDPQPYAPLLFTATPSSTLAAGGHGATPTGGHQTSATHPDGFGTAGYFTGGGTPGNVLTPNTGRGSFFGGATPGGGATGKRVFGRRAGGAGGDSVGGDGTSTAAATPNSAGSFRGGVADSSGGGGHLGTPWAKGKRGAVAGDVEATATQEAGADGAVTADCWVTVFGFAPEDTTAVLSEFQRDGDVMFWSTFQDDGAPANWVHVRFASRDSARRALQRNGSRVGHAHGASIMVGVKPLDDAARAVVEADHGGVGLGQSVGAGGDGEGAGSTPARGKPAQMLRPKVGMAQPAARAYRVQPSREGIVLQPRRTGWGKVVEFIFGM